MLHKDQFCKNDVITSFNYYSNGIGTCATYFTDSDTIKNAGIGPILIKTHGSELRGQEEAAVRDERVSYLHVALL